MVDRAGNAPKYVAFSLCDARNNRTFVRVANANAQEAESRSYTNTQVGLNFLIVATSVPKVGNRSSRRQTEGLQSDASLVDSNDICCCEFRRRDYAATT